jgi:hypothetical protein
MTNAGACLLALGADPGRIAPEGPKAMSRVAGLSGRLAGSGRAFARIDLASEPCNAWPVAARQTPRSLGRETKCYKR